MIGYWRGWRRASAIVAMESIFELLMCVCGVVEIHLIDGHLVGFIDLLL